MTVFEATSAVSRVSEWVFERALPHYAQHAIGPNGLAHEEFDSEGRPKDTGSLRTMVQFRQIYVLSHAALLGRCDPSLASGLWRAIGAVAGHEHGGWVHRVSSDGRALPGSRKAYDQAFSLLACAWVYELTGAGEALESARRTLQFLDAHMRGESAGYLDALPARLPRRQNPHMHLYEALLALYEVSGEAGFLARADELRALLESRFISPQGGLREYFDRDLQPVAGADGRTVEPGHHFEWVWLLNQHARLEGEAIDPLAQRLFEFATAHGLGLGGLPIEEIDIDGTPRKRSLKLWAATEQLKAWTTVSDPREPEAISAAERVVAGIFQWFLPATGAPVWHERIDERGQPATDRMPASTLYHLTLAFTEYLRWHDRLPRVLGRRRSRS